MHLRQMTQMGKQQKKQRKLMGRQQRKLRNPQQKLREQQHLKQSKKQTHLPNNSYLSNALIIK